MNNNMVRKKNRVEASKFYESKQAFDSLRTLFFCWLLIGSIAPYWLRGNTISLSGFSLAEKEPHFPLIFLIGSERPTFSFLASDWLRGNHIPNSGFWLAESDPHPPFWLLIGWERTPFPILASYWLRRNPIPHYCFSLADRKPNPPWWTHIRSNKPEFLALSKSADNLWYPAK